MKSDMVKPLLIGMLMLQALTVALLWLLDAFSIEATAAFALLLAGNIVAFALVAHVYRTSARESEPEEAHASGEPPVPAK